MIFFLKWRNLLLCSLSALLLILSFPQTDWWGLGFFAFIPLFFSLEGRTPWESFHLSYFFGWIFFFGMFYWIFFVPPEVLTIIGVFLLVSYFSIYIGVFGLFYNYFYKKKPILKVFLISSAWVVLEYLRGHVFSDFGWASLGHCQYKNLVLIQIADIVGVYGVSFVLIFLNLFIKEILDFLFFSSARCQRKGKELISLSCLCVVLVGGIVGYGMFCLKTLGENISRGMKAAVIQANIKQRDKMNPSRWIENLNKHMALSTQAAGEKPELIVWPETSLPGFLQGDDEYLRRLKKFVKTIKIPILLGSVEKEGMKYFNSAVLISAQGKIIEKYQKTHLVPFGEYIPLRTTLPFLSDIVPIGDFSSGNRFTNFSLKKESFLGSRGNNFSVLICFEDTVPRLARIFANKGADFFINITNDGWFKDTKAPFMHLQTSIFRSIENRRSLIRAANTGVSCFIDPVGRVYSKVQETSLAQKRKGLACFFKKNKSTFVEGYALDHIYLEEKKTFYSKVGDFFPLFCFLAILIFILKLFINLKI